MNSKPQPIFARGVPLWCGLAVLGGAAFTLCLGGFAGDLTARLSLWLLFAQPSIACGFALAALSLILVQRLVRCGLAAIIIVIAASTLLGAPLMASWWPSTELQTPSLPAADPSSVLLPHGGLALVGLLFFALSTASACMGNLGWRCIAQGLLLASVVTGLGVFIRNDAIATSGENTDAVATFGATVQASTSFIVLGYGRWRALWSVAADDAASDESDWARRNLAWMLGVFSVLAAVLSLALGRFFEVSGREEIVLMLSGQGAVVGALLLWANAPTDMELRRANRAAAQAQAISLAWWEWIPGAPSQRWDPFVASQLRVPSPVDCDAAPLWQDFVSASERGRVEEALEVAAASGKPFSFVCSLARSADAINLAPRRIEVRGRWSRTEGSERGLISGAILAAGSSDRASSLEGLGPVEVCTWLEAGGDRAAAILTREGETLEIGLQLRALLDERRGAGDFERGRGELFANLSLFRGDALAQRLLAAALARIDPAGAVAERVELPAVDGLHGALLIELRTLPPTTSGTQISAVVLPLQTLGILPAGPADTEARWLAAVETAGFGAWEFDPATRVVWSSRRHGEILGRTMNDPRERYDTLMEQVVDADRPRIDAEFRHLIETGEHWNFECRIRRLDGEIRWISGFGAVQQTPVSRKRCVIGLIQDITERKVEEAVVRAAETSRVRLSEQRAAELALREVAEQNQAVLDNALDGIITISELGIVLSMNRSASTMFEFALEEVLGQNINMLMPQPYRGEHDGYLRNFRETGVKKIIGIGREVEGRRKSGTNFPMELSVSECTSNGKRIFIGLVRDVTERRRLERMKSEFISTVNHELRTPLTSINGALGMVCAGALGAVNDDAKAILDIAYTNSRRLALLINDLLDLEKLAAGRMELFCAEQELTPVLERAIQNMESYGAKLGVRYALQDGAADARVFIEAGRLEQVLGNLLSNAAKYSPREGIVEVSATIAVGNGGSSIARIDVIDHGDGVPSEFVGRLFEKFAQADASSTRGKGGTGLGLAISKELAEAMHGTLVYTPTVGGGATFRIDLPLAGAQQGGALVEQCVEQADRSSSSMMEVAGRGGCPFHASGASTARAPGLEKGLAHAAARFGTKKILVVAVTVAEQRVMVDLCAQLGIAAVAVGTRSEALAAVTGGGYQVVLVALGAGGRGVVAGGEPGTESRAEFDAHRESDLDPGFLIDLERAAQSSPDSPRLVVINAFDPSLTAPLECATVDFIQQPLSGDLLCGLLGRRDLASGGERQRVLHVEDDLGLQRILGEALSLRGVAVQGASNLAAARELLTHNAYDLVILDILLPDGSGWELLPTITQNQSHPRVVVLSMREQSAPLGASVALSVVKSRVSTSELIESILQAIPQRGEHARDAEVTGPPIPRPQV